MQENGITEKCLNLEKWLRTKSMRDKVGPYPQQYHNAHICTMRNSYKIIFVNSKHFLDLPKHHTDHHACCHTPLEPYTFFSI